MKWNTETRYKILLEINNAIATQKSRADLFKALSKELKRHFDYDRLSIILYDSEIKSINYFATADGIQPGGVVAQQSRLLAHGAIAQIAIKSGQPTVFDDLTRYVDLSSVGELVKAGITSTLAFPMILRGKVLGTIHFSYRQKPHAITELTEVLMDVSQQIAIAVDNIVSYTSLQQSNEHLLEEKQYLLSHNHDCQEDGFFFASQTMQQVVEIITQVADTDETILLMGETGTGKDFLARLIHERSPRKNHLFVKTNCPGLTTSLFESELFGHAKGAFTGAERQRIGRFELADKGTIFLDEIGELPLNLQAKLLQVLQDRRFERVGESESTPVDARIVAATNKNLLESVKKGEFRQDLFYRLDTVTITIPALRDRLEDLPLLLDNITVSEADRMHKPAPVYTDCALTLLSGYSWPGNIRELKNMVKRLIILKSGERITAREIEGMFPTIAVSPEHAGKICSLKELEKKHIIEALTATQGMVGGKLGAAKLLGVPRSTLNYRINKLGIVPGDFQRVSSN